MEGYADTDMTDIYTTEDLEAAANESLLGGVSILCRI